MSVIDFKAKVAELRDKRIKKEHPNTTEIMTDIIKELE